MPARICIYQHEASEPDRYCLDLQGRNDFGWSLGKPAFFAFAEPAPGTVPIYQHEAGSPDRYFYDLNPVNNFGWSGGKAVFHAFAAQAPGTVPIYVHEAADPYRYYYDLQVENRFGWSPGKVAFYAFPPIASLIDDIVTALGASGTDNQGVTYGVYEGNRFELHATPGLWNVGANTPEALLANAKPGDPYPIRDSRRFVESLRQVIGSATRYVDITLLWFTGSGLPTGEFQAAIAEGLAAANSPAVVVRILIGVPPLIIVRDEDLKDWLESTVQCNGRRLGDMRCAIHVGRAHQSLSSWSHAKIVAADGRAVMVGGHNLWQEPYLGKSPVNDVSCRFDGAAAVAAHLFCNTLWQHPFGAVVSLVGGSLVSTARPPAFSPLPPVAVSPGSTRVLALGRLGGIPSRPTVASNASVSARLAAMTRATSSIRISQQSLYFEIAGVYTNQSNFDFHTCMAIVRAIRNGVSVSIVVSNEVSIPDGGYKGYLEQTVSFLATLYLTDRAGGIPYPMPDQGDLVGWMKAGLDQPLPLGPPAHFPSPKDIPGQLEEFNARLQVAPLTHSENVGYWLVSGRQLPAANHAKVWIIDDRYAYIGSDNMYLSGSAAGLQEFGYLIEDTAVVKQIIDDYWTQLWKHSSGRVLRATPSLLA